MNLPEFKRHSITKMTKHIEMLSLVTLTALFAMSTIPNAIRYIGNITPTWPNIPLRKSPSIFPNSPAA